MESEVIFITTPLMTKETLEEVQQTISASLPDYKVVVLPPGVGVSSATDVGRLCQSIDCLQEMVASLVQVNQEVLGALLDVLEVEEQKPAAKSHLGLSHRG